MEGLTLEYLFKFFPNAKLSLDGAPGTNVQTVGDNSPGVLQANGPITSAASNIEDYRHRLQDNLIAADLPGDILKTVLNIVKNTK